LAFSKPQETFSSQVATHCCCCIQVVVCSDL
jgi:hypothetical protein